jgi:putative DNA primase/helicase
MKGYIDVTETTSTIKPEPAWALLDENDIIALAAAAAAAAKPTVKYHSTQLPRVMAEAEAILVEKMIPLFVFEGKLVRLEISKYFDEDDGVSVKLNPVTIDMMLYHLIVEIDWVAFDSDAKCDVAYKPPKEFAAMMMQRSDCWTYRPLKAIARCPFVRMDSGNLVNTYGYDTSTGVYLVDPVAMPNIAGISGLTKSDAEAALGYLRKFFSETKYADDEGRSEAAQIAGVMTVVLRPSFKVVPGWINQAHVGGSGKSAPQEAAGIIATGRKPGAIAAGRNADEFEKRMVGAMLSGESQLLLDNFNQSLEGEFIAQAVSQEYLKIRALGKSDMITVRNNATVVINGNQLEIVGEQRRRYMCCRIEPNMENPENRKFKIKIFDCAKRDRGFLLNCIFTIVRAFIKADRPYVCDKPLAGFEEWSDTIRAALMWLGMADPLGNAEAMKDEDTGDMQIRSILSNWPFATGKGEDNEKSAGDIVAALMNSSYSGTRIREDILAVAYDLKRPEHISSIRLGRYFAKIKGIVRGGLVLRSRVHCNQNVFWIERI